MEKYSTPATAPEADVRTRLAQQEQKFEDLTHVAWSLTSLLDLEQVLAALMDVAVRMVGAEVGGIFVQRGGKTEVQVSWGLSAEVAGSIQIGDQDLVSHVCTSRQSVNLREQTVVVVSSAGQIFINALLAVPIVAHDRVFGVLILVNPLSGEGFQGDALRTAEMLVGFAAVAIQNAELLEQHLAQQKVEQQLAVARSVQTTLLPPSDLAFPGLQWQALYVPAYEIGGDYYDLIRISDHEIAVVVADVSSKGIPAALMMTAVRSVVRSESFRRGETGSIISRVNRILCADFTRNQDMYVSLFYAYLNLARGRMTFTNGGHLPPYFWNAEHSEPRPLKTGGIILGQFDDFEFEQEEVELGPGWRLVGFTDGVTETENIREELFGTQRVQEFIRAHADCPAGVFLSQMKGALEAFAAGQTEQDDLTLLWVGGNSTS